MLDSIRYWLRGQERQNFGDALARVYMDKLFLPVGSSASSIHLVGSVIDDMFVEDARKIDHAAEPVFWGCGIRTTAGLSEQNRQLAKILAVRGPISAKELNLEGRVPIGDSALLLPAIYTPRHIHSVSARTICIPHFHDLRSDEDLLAITNCDEVLRAFVGANLQDIYETIDQIASAKFVLSASLHGAIVAAVYGRPFCFWDSGNIDLPLKWRDFSASIGIPCHFAPAIVEATKFYDENVRGKIELPPLLPLVLAAPFVVRTDAMSKIWSWVSKDNESGLDEMTSEETPVSAANKMILKATMTNQMLREKNEEQNRELRLYAEKDEADQDRQLQEQAKNLERLSRDAFSKYEQIKSLLNSRERYRRGPISKLLFRWRARRDEKIIRRSGLFAEGWYRSSYPELSPGKNVVRHYVTRGRYEGKNPNPYFITAWYQATYPETLLSGSNPLIDYLRKGAREGRNPGPQFNTCEYYNSHPEVKRAGINPLAHYLSEISTKADHQSETAAAPTCDDVGNPRWMTSEGRPKVVIIDSVYPTPDKDSGSIDAVNFVNTFKLLGYDVAFVSDSQFYDKNITSECLKLMDVELVNVSRYPSLEQFIRQEGKSVSIFFLSRVDCGGRWLETAFRYSNAKLIFNTVDLHFLRQEREAKLNKDRAALNLAAKTKEREMVVTRLADATIVVSEAEGELLELLVPDAKVAVIPLGRACPGSTKSFDQRRDIGFIGGFAHTPNIDAVVYFVNDIWPIIKKKDPSMKFYIYGSDMPSSFFAFNALDVVPVGYVKDLGPTLEKHRVMVAPLRYGAGAKGKVATSLAHGVPCVATGIAAEGMGLTPGKDILVATSPDLFAAAVLELNSNKVLWSTVSTSGMSTARQQFSPQNTVDKIKTLLSEIDNSSGT